MRKRRNEYPTLEACKQGRLRQLWERERDGLLPACPLERAEEVAAKKIADRAWREWCTLEDIMYDQPREGEIILYDWLFKHEWRERFAPFGAIPGENPEPLPLRTPAERLKPRVLDLVRVQTATRDGFEIRYNVRVRKEFQHRVSAALAFCATRDDAEETRRRLYAAYLQGKPSPLLAGYRRLFVVGKTSEPIRLVNEVMLTRREPAIYVQKAIGPVASYRLFRYPYGKDERFVVASLCTDEADYRPSYFIDHHEDIVADFQVLGDTQELLGLSWFDDPVAHVEWDQERRRYRCRAALIGHESLDALESETLEGAVEQCLGELERLLAKGPVAKFPSERENRWRGETKRPRRRKARSRAGGTPARVVFYALDPAYAHLDYAQACAYFVQNVDLCERCHLYLAYLELQERLEDLEPFIRKVPSVERDALADTFVAGVRLALKSVGVYCRACEKRMLSAAQRELLPLVLRDAEQAAGLEQ